MGTISAYREESQQYILIMLGLRGGKLGTASISAALSLVSLIWSRIGSSSAASSNLVRILLNNLGQTKATRPSDS